MMSTWLHHPTIQFNMLCSINRHSLFCVSSDVPGPPASAKYVEVFATSIKISWEPPLKDGGAEISNYIVNKRETSRANWAQVSTKIKGNVLEFNVEKLIEGREYQFRIQAENMWGVGDPLITSPVFAKNPFSESSAAFSLGFYITTNINDSEELKQSVLQFFKYFNI